MTKNDPDLSKALWRYGIISPLLHRRDDDPTMADMLCSLAKKTFIRPDGAPIALSAETLRKWLYRYRSDGAICEALPPTAQWGLRLGG